MTHGLFHLCPPATLTPQEWFWSVGLIGASLVLAALLASVWVLGRKS